MHAYLLVSFTPTDPEQLRQYAAAVPATLSPFGGEMLAKGAIEALHGEPRFTMQALIGFADKADAGAWYASAAYQAIIPLRDAGMDSQFTLLG